MATGLKISAFLLALAAVFALALGAGSLLDPLGGATEHDGHSAAASDTA